MSPPKKNLKVFLCHAHNDKAAVHKLYHRIIKDGINAWLDEEELYPGQDWEYEIRKAILKSDVVIVCLSRAFNKQHGYRHEELKIALEKAYILANDIFIIPVRLEECDMPESLHHLHRVDLFKTGGYGRLIRALQGQVESK
jgi:TIR domain